MAKYIERETLLTHAIALNNPHELGENVVPVSDIEAAPAADVAHVVHGRWEQRKTPLGKTYSICSNCSTDFKFITDKGTLVRLDIDGMPYCPNCGAKMDKEGTK